LVLADFNAWEETGVVEGNGVEHSANWQVAPYLNTYVPSGQSFPSLPQLGCVTQVADGLDVATEGVMGLISSFSYWMPKKKPMKGNKTKQVNASNLERGVTVV
jgi:hypothetical protein